MADTDVLVSELDSASAINTNDLLLMTQPDGEAQTGYASRKGTVLQAATKMLKGIEFETDLPHFENKTVLGGLEELSTGKANTSGEYNELISGQANALKPSTRLENSTPYLFRKSFANGYGYETIKGGTCGVNQLVDLTSATSVGNFNIVNSYEMNCKIDITSVQYPALPSVTFTEGHKYYIVVQNGTSANVRFYYDTSYTKYNDTGANTKSERVVYANGFTVSVPFLTLNSGALTGETIKLNVIDLTQMFGTSIADFVYTLESGTSGAGITWLKNNGFFGADYYPYNSGALLSVKTSKKINRGKNLTDISDNTIANADYVIGGFPVAINADNVVLPVGDYVFSFNVQNATFPCACQLIWYRNWVEVGNTVESISASGIASIAFAASGEFDSFAMFCNSSSGGEFTNFNLNIGSTPSAYEPYVSHEYTLDDIELRGILKLDGSNNLYYDGDTYESNGSVTRKYGIVDLSTLNWYSISGDRLKTNDTIGLSKPAINTEKTNLIAQNYINADSDYWLAEDTSRKCYISMSEDGGTIVRLKDGELNPSGYLVYELATPTTETADPFTNPMMVDGNGTEEFVDGRTVEMPVGHETIYVDDNDATKLESLPDISNYGNGTYLVKQANGQMSLVKYGIPNPPTTDGRYRLEVTVTDGVPAYSWEVIS